ncbi:urease accessory protein UreD [Paenibacillus sp. sptzw28]|nr:urease accessory protein UreD [Paenibacillus sp. sptzw28]
MNMAQPSAIATDNGQPAGRISQLRAAFVNRGGKTQLESKYHTAPIKIAKTFPLEGAVGVMVMDVSPGLLAGDRYELEWKAGKDAHIYVTNQSFTKVHPCPDAGSGSSISQVYRLEAGAVVESMPEPVMLYRGASLTCETEVSLSAGSVWMQAEVLCPGRTLRGERFAYREYRNRLRVTYEDELIFAQNQLIEPGQQRLTTPGCFGGMTHTSVLYAFSDKLAMPHIEAVRAALAGLPARDGHQVIAGVSATYKYGLAVMAAGTAAWPLQEAMSAAWQAVRASLLGKEPLNFRK